MIHGGSRPDLAATIMTEDAKTEENTAGSSCGAYIERISKKVVGVTTLTKSEVGDFFYDESVLF